MRNLLATELAALSNARYFIPIDLLTIKSWRSVQLKNTANHPIVGITFLTIDKEDMVAVRENLKPPCELNIAPATRSCHHFISTSQYTIKGKQLSINTTIFITHSFLDMPVPQNETLESLKCNDYITCCFDGFWWLALIEVVNKEEKGLTCKFLHSYGPSLSISWWW